MTLSMNLVGDIGGHRIGEWRFHPAAGELRRRSEVRRLEPRAAKTLELLCAARGGVVTHEQLIQEVWSGRSLSENSVAVVVGQLRRALDDDARDAKLIETIPKRGYRLIGSASVPASRPARWRVITATAVAILVGIGAVLAVRSMISRPDIAMTDIANQTGDPRYDSLARATSELMLAELSKRGFDVERGSRGQMSITGKLVMWNGGPYLGLSATDTDGVVRWSGMTKGGPDVAPAGLRAELDDFQAKIDR
jgi:DNA-binding winged helix-turn-helix (wHTH) protein